MNLNTLWGGGGSREVNRIQEVKPVQDLSRDRLQHVVIVVSMDQWSLCGGTTVSGSRTSLLWSLHVDRWGLTGTKPGTYYQGWFMYMRYTQGQNEEYLLPRSITKPGTIASSMHSVYRSADTSRTANHRNL